MSVATKNKNGLKGEIPWDFLSFHRLTLLLEEMSPILQVPKLMMKIISTNRKANFEYTLLDKFEAGIVLTGSEVKSLRTNQVSLCRDG